MGLGAIHRGRALMGHVRDALAENFDATVRRGGQTTVFGQRCEELDREELLAALAMAMDQYQQSIAGHEATRRMHEVFDQARRRRGM